MSNNYRASRRRVDFTARVDFQLIKCVIKARARQREGESERATAKLVLHIFNLLFAIFHLKIKNH